MRNTTLCYLERGREYLLLHRVKLEDDENRDKWIGVGGKFEPGETPEECMRREVYEETNLYIDHYRYCGIVTFVSDDNETEYMHLFTVTGFHDRNGVYVSGGTLQPGAREIALKDCVEGQLEWLPKEKLTQIPHWAGDRIFLPLILDMEIPFFSMKLVYRSGELIHASMNEHNCLVTDRLILRPWLDEDAATLYKWAKNPKIGPSAGWAAHPDEACSLQSIRDILQRPEIYAIVLRDTAEPIGSVGLQNFRLVDRHGNCFAHFDERQSEDPLVCTKPGRWLDPSDPNMYFSSEEEEDRQDMLPGGWRIEPELGYWLAEPFWHQGIMTEAAGTVLAHAWKDLGIRRVWADYYEGNEPSRKVMERLGFHFHHIEEDRYLPSLHERRTAVVQVLDLDKAKQLAELEREEPLTDPENEE